MLIPYATSGSSGSRSYSEYLSYHLIAASQHGIKVSVSLSFALVTSLSLPITLIMLALKPQHKHVTLLEKILYPLMPYGFFVLCRSWLFWNSVAHRLNGKADDKISDLHAVGESDHLHVLLVVMANLSSITNVMLVIMLDHKAIHPVMMWSMVVLFGTLNYLLDFYTDVVDAFRKHVEYHGRNNRSLLPLFQQPLVRPVSVYVDKVAIIIRECLPIFRGLIRARAFISVLSHWVMSHHRSVNACASIMAFFVYCGSAYSAGFELIQLRDNLEGLGHTLMVQNHCSQSPSSVVRMIGHLCSGQALMDSLQFMRVPVLMSFYMTLGLSAMGTASLIKQVLTVYLSSNHHQGVFSENEGLVLQYYMGHDRALEIAPAMEVVIAFVSVFLGGLSVCAQAPTLSEYRQSLFYVISAQVIPGDFDSPVEDAQGEVFTEREEAVIQPC